MNPIRFAIERPVAVLAVVAMAVLFGAIAVTRIPIQLAPDVRKPVVVITTDWPGAAPAEVEREIVNPQEEALRGLDGLEIMTSRAQTGEAEITLEFAVGTNMEPGALCWWRTGSTGCPGIRRKRTNPSLGTSGVRRQSRSPGWFIIKREPGQ